VAVLVQGGKQHGVIGTVAANLPKQQGKEQIVAGKTINVADLLPKDRGYYHFMGSLTTPPCSEGVKWFVLKKPVEASSTQVAAFSKLFGSNARPVQPLHARVVKQTR
jgi:carbonic anhydrase